MSLPLRVLNVEDSEDDALLLLRHMTRAGYDVTFERVDTAEALQNALDAGRWDVVVADYVLPGFSAPAAIAMLNDKQPDVPVIVVSGADGFDIGSLAALCAGARDYLMKNHLARLIPAVGLAAGVLAEVDRPAAHLTLCQEYLQLSPPNLVKALSHGTQALADAKEAGEKAASIKAKAMLYVGICHLRLNQFLEAVALFRRFESAKAELDIPDSTLEAEVQLQLGHALECLGDHEGAYTALKQAHDWFRCLGLTNRADECCRHLIRLNRVKEGVASGEAECCAVKQAAWTIHLERGEYHLISDEPVQAVREALTALEKAGNDSVGCFDCYFLLMRCAQRQGDHKDAINFALCARMMALDASRLDLAARANERLLDMMNQLGNRADQMLRQLEVEYSRVGVDLSQYLPEIT